MMDFSKLTDDELLEYIFSKGYNPSQDLARQASEIFDEDQALTTIPVEDLYIATQSANTLNKFYSSSYILNMSNEKAKQLSEKIGLSYVDRTRILRVLKILGLIYSDHNEICSICDSKQFSICKLCDMFLMKPNVQNDLHKHSKLLQYHYIDNILNEIYLNKNVNINSIIIHPLMQNGFGDIIFAVKLYNLLKQYVTQNVLVIGQPHTVRGLNQIDASIPTLDVSPLEKLNDIDEPWVNPDYMIITPYILSCKLVNNSIYPGRNIRPKLSIVVDEYTAFNHEGSLHIETEVSCRLCRSSGLFYDSMGIFVDRNTERFDKINDSVFKKFFEQHMKKSKIYFGYAYLAENAFGFIYLVLRMNKHVKENITIFSRFSQQNSWDDKLFVKCAKEYGYNITIFSHYRVVYTFDGNKSKKRLIIVNTANIPYDDIQYIMRISNKFALVTGDQSFSDAISHNKVFIYETLDHKVNFKQTIDFLINAVDLVDIKELWKLVAANNDSDVVINVDNGTPDSTITKISDLIYKTDSFNIFNNIIKDNFDIQPNMVGMLKRLHIYKNNPQNIDEDEKYLRSYINSGLLDEYFNHMRKIMNKCNNL